ncbi:MAG: DUF3168 domain-containing protein [Rhodobiaceae bacterium]|nr:DUF3168 domain-containing protein [Rhodobiaceae bacterium]
MSASSSLALQTALYDAVTAALPGVAVYDHVPPDAGFPYVTFGQAVTRDIGGAAAPLDEHTLQVFVWSRAESRVEAAEKAETVRAALETAAVSATGHAIVNRAVEQIDITRDPKTRIFRAQLRLRAATEPTS